MGVNEVNNAIMLHLKLNSKWEIPIFTDQDSLILIEESIFMLYHTALLFSFLKGYF